jgi:hypothetical protein
LLFALILLHLLYVCTYLSRTSEKKNISSRL